MGYYFNKVVSNVSFDEAIKKTTEELQKEDFDIISSVDFKKTFDEKLNVKLSEYTVLGACNTELVNEALKSEVLIGLMLPCNILVKRIDVISIEVAIVDPMESLAIFNNEEVNKIVGVLQERLIRVINNI